MKLDRKQEPVGHRNDGELTALILAVFALAWFGWGEADASAVLSVLLSVGSSAAVAVGLLAAFRVFRRQRAEHAMGDPTVRRRYFVVVAVEFAAAGLGAAALGVTGAAAYIPVWVCAVVGLHFVALAPVFGTSALRWLGVAVTAVAAAALLVGVLTAVAPSSVTGGGTGLVLLGFAIMTLAGSIASAPERRRHEHVLG